MSADTWGYIILWVIAVASLAITLYREWRGWHNERRRQAWWAELGLQRSHASGRMPRRIRRRTPGRPPGLHIVPSDEPPNDAA